jgi:hypothetical protein
MENADGKMRLTDGTLVPPSDPRYATAAISKALMNTSLMANKTDRDMTDRSSTYAPPGNLTNFGTTDPLMAGNAMAIDVNSLGANPAKPDDFRTTFGVDDIYGDRNFNTAIFNPSTKV